jgi:hypothetical protein
MFSESLRTMLIEEWNLQRAEAVRRGLLPHDAIQQLEHHRRPE